MPKHLFFLKDPSLFADAPVEGAADGAALAKVPEWVNVLPEPDQDGLIFSRDNRVLHIDDMAKLAARSNKALKKQKGGGLVDKDHETYGGFFVSGGGPAIAWAEEFEARPGKGMWARTEWLPAGEQLVGSKQYRYTSSVVDGDVTAEVDEEAWTVTWHITPDTVEGFAITNLPALTTTSMFSAQPDRQAEELRLLVLKKLGLSADADNEAVKAAWLKRFTSAGEAAPAPEAEAPPDEADDQEEDDDAAVPPVEPPPVEPPAEPVASASAETELLRSELATARKRIADLEVEAGAAFVKSLLHSGKLTPAQRKAAEEQARTPTGLAQLRALYEHAPAILPTGRTPTAGPDTSPAKPPHGVDPLAYDLARQGVPAHEIARQLQQRAKETAR